MIPKKPGPDLIRGVQRFSEKTMLDLLPGRETDVVTGESQCAGEYQATVAYAKAQDSAQGGGQGSGHGAAQRAKPPLPVQAAE
jgi:hypothetical protein